MKEGQSGDAGPRSATGNPSRGPGHHQSHKERGIGLCEHCGKYCDGLCRADHELQDKRVEALKADRR